MIEQFTTITGLPLMDAIEAMKAVLPPEAYKGVPGGANLTDISPAYLTEKATEVFGPIGLGWWFEWDPTQVEQSFNPENKFEQYTVLIKDFSLFYAYVHTGQLSTSHPVKASGGSANKKSDYAFKGAITGAIGAAFSKLCWQIYVYKGKVDHKNAASKYKEYQLMHAEKEKGKSPEQLLEELGTKAKAPADRFYREPDLPFDDVEEPLDHPNEVGVQVALDLGENLNPYGDWPPEVIHQIIKKRMVGNKSPEVTGERITKTVDIVNRSTIITPDDNPSYVYGWVSKYIQERKVGTPNEIAVDIADEAIVEAMKQAG